MRNTLFNALMMLRAMIMDSITIYAPTPKPVRSVKPNPINTHEVKPTAVAKPATAVATPTFNPNFTEDEIGCIVKNMGKDMTARLTPYNNVILQHKEANKTLFSFYKRKDGYLIRRRLGYDNPFGSGNVLNGGKTLPTIEKAMEYFTEYKRKYPNSLR